MEETKSIIKEFISFIDAEIEEISFQENILYVNLKAFGLTEILDDIQYLLKKIIAKKTGQFFYLHLDINGYKKKKEEQLKQAVQIIADQVALFKKEKILNPMPAYERRIIHLELASRTDIKTESIGESKERKVIIRPV
ncbi:MAG: hypothetical protein PHN37_02185 [Candidatus Pacebacteria bacterium]|nr:hypothetical protein [Candidatus Paceibacterota bacterium]